MNVGVATLPVAAAVGSPRASQQPPGGKTLLGALRDELGDLVDGVRKRPFSGDDAGFEEAQRQATNHPYARMTGTALIGGLVGGGCALGATLFGAPLSTELLMLGAGAGAAATVGAFHGKELWQHEFVQELRKHPVKSLACAAVLGGLGALKGPLDAVILGSIGLWISNQGIRNSARWVGKHPGFAALGLAAGAVGAVVAFAPSTGALAVAKPIAALTVGTALGVTKGAWAHQKYTRAVPPEKRTALGHVAAFGVPLVMVLGGCMMYPFVPPALYITGKMKGGFLSGLAMEDLRKDRLNQPR